MRTFFNALRWCWQALDVLRRTLLNLVLLVLLAGLVWALLHIGPPPLQDRTTLVLAINGPIREQFSASLRGSALSELHGRRAVETRLRDLLAAIDGAATDPQIERLLLLTDDFAGSGPATLHEVAAALERFRARGKQVVAWGSAFDQRQYYLAAHANEVWMHPMGSVQIMGFGGYRSYYKDALDRFGISVHVLRAGQYKNAGESFVANAPSKQTLEADRALYDDLWHGYTSEIERVRKLAPGSLQQGMDDVAARLAAAGGDLAKMALDAKLVDALKTRDELRAALVQRGVKDGKTFRQIPFAAYLARIKPEPAADAVAVVVAEGNIVDGVAPPGAIGGLSTADLIRQAREDEHVKALVLRVDSPGGSAFSAELIRRELELTRAAGKPVVVSMGDVAASGGYWISMAADEVIADPGTITGSIGVIAMLPSVERGLGKLGVHSGGYTTGWLVGAYDPRRGLDPKFAQLVQASIDHTYVDFTSKAAAARKTTREKIDAVAQGRVWSGAQAKALGLIDRTGSFDDALAAATARARLLVAHRVQYMEREPGRMERLIAWLNSRLGITIELGVDSPLALPLARELQRDAAWLAEVGDGSKPFVAQAHCLCSAP